ncbi:MAG: Lrp/AsnC family transcriptional regulator [Candidatus Heimdallarchaeota archaeon]|nr:Lrp/AsnC family transcriptional regulator [Candidatus Heimdallarchaeota archaeon]
MDEVDLHIMQLLTINSRLTNRELADATSLSVSAVHKRIKSLEENQVITAYIARPSIIALNSIPVVIFGRSKAKSMKIIKELLGSHENIFSIAIASGNMIYISGMLRNISELQVISTFAQSEGLLDDYQVGLVNEPYGSPVQLSPTEFKILKSLNRDARKSLVDVAKDIGSSAKTVRRYLEEMIDEQKVSFTIEWAPLYQQSFISVFHIYTTASQNTSEMVQKLIEKFSNNLVVCVSFGNIPNFILLETWSPSARDSQDILEELQEEGFTDIIPHVLLSINWFSNWIDDLIDSKV